MSTTVADALERLHGFVDVRIERTVAHDERGLDLIEEADELVDRAPGVHREHHRAEPGEAEPGEDLRGKVAADDEDDVALAHPVAHEPGRGVADELLRLGERELLVATDEPRSIRSRTRRVRQQLGNGPHHSVIYHVKPRGALAPL